MAFTPEDVAALEKAIAGGVLKARMSNGEEVQFDSMGDLVRRLRFVESRLTPQGGGGFLVTQPNMDRGL
jgi:hypothetical protein